MPEFTFAWCFGHGALHLFEGEPWCTAAWVAFVAGTWEVAMEAKVAAYGNAVFLDELSPEQQLEVLEIRNTWNC